MNISIPSRYYSDTAGFILAWYHNESRVESSDRITIADNGTSLTLRNTADSDAGQYEVKVDSRTFVLENSALFAPAVFLLAQNTLPIYNPDSIVENYSIPPYDGDNQQTFTIV